MNTNQTKTQIVILGGGFGGAYCARLLEKRLRSHEAEIALINRTNYFVFTPLLVEAGTGALEPRHAVVPLRRFLKRTHQVMAEVTEIDIADREVVMESFLGKRNLRPYDHLVLALGSVTRLPDVPGLHQYGFGMKNLADAVALRDRAVGLLELANEAHDPEQRQALLTFVIVGANYTGVEVAGEYNEFLTEATRMFRNISREDIRVILIEMEPRILPALDEDMAQYASDRLSKRGVELQLNQTVTRIDEHSAELESGQIVQTSTVIWVAGVAQNPLLNDLDLPQNDCGYLACDHDLRVKGSNNIWALGDNAANPDPEGNPYPPTAQHAIREGRAAAENIVRTLRGQPSQPLKYRSRGMMAPLGRHQAVARIMGMKLSGFSAWFVWRTFYLFKMPGFGRSLRVMLDWTLDLFFRRDYVQLGIHEPQLSSAGKAVEAPEALSQDNRPATANIRAS